MAHEHGYDVLLDAAAYLPSNRLDLSVVKPDFVPVSWYKVFGYPTGVGCLIARREALGRLWRPWFAGGSVHVASVQGDWHTLAAGEARFEDGTVSFLQIPDLESGLSWVNGIGIDLIHQRVMCLTGWLIDRLASLRHGNGEPMVRIYGPANTRDRGGTVAFNLLDPGGRVIDERAVAGATAAAGISIRTGCFCNPGAGEGAFQLTKAGWRTARAGAPGPWISTSACSACPAAGRCAHRWAWSPTSTTWSGSWPSWRPLTGIAWPAPAASHPGGAVESLRMAGLCYRSEEVIVVKGPGSARRLLGVFAHPDDEVFCAGGTMARAADAGAEVMIVSATRGEQGQIRDPAPPPGARSARSGSASFARLPPSSARSARRCWPTRTGACSSTGPRWGPRSLTSCGSSIQTRL